jgi:hypothetical protein
MTMTPLTTFFGVRIVKKSPDEPVPPLRRSPFVLCGEEQAQSTKGERLCRAKGRLAVNLGLLQLAAIVGVDDLPLGKDIQAGNACLAMAVARATRAAKGELDLGPCSARIDVEDACRDIARGPLYAIDILCIDRTG